MKNLFFTFMFFVTNAAFAGSGIFEYYINTNLLSYGDFSGGASFNNANLGTVTLYSDPLSISLSGLKTWEDLGSEVSSARMNYKIWKDGDTEPSSFTALNLPQYGNKSGNNREWQSNSSINLLNGLTTTGTYYVKIYFDATSTDGTLYHSNNGSNYTASFVIGSVLPVSLSAFNGQKHNSSVVLDWVTASETNNAFFAVEKSANGEVFETIGVVEGAGTSVEENKYTFEDKAPFKGTNYYRLKQTDFDGAFEYSKVVAVEFDGTAQATIYPNPATDKLIVSTPIQEEVTVRLFNAVGQVVYQNTQRIDNQLEINISDLISGNYFYSITTNNATI
jgi:hypothetical protein